MRKIDIDKLSKRMPYKPLDESYFDALPFETLDKVEARKIEQPISAQRRWSLTRPLSIATATTMAAAAMIALFVAINPNDDNSPNISSEEQIDKFVSTLSDSDLESLVNEAESNYEFYANI